jgi:hypothetical protein
MNADKRKKLEKPDLRHGVDNENFAGKPPNTVKPGSAPVGPGVGMPAAGQTTHEKRRLLARSDALRIGRPMDVSCLRKRFRFLASDNSLLREKVAFQRFVGNRHCGPAWRAVPRICLAACTSGTKQKSPASRAE